MGGSSDLKKLALWRDRFRRFFDSGLTVARFSAVEQVSESSFYYWQKKLGPQGLRRLAGAKDGGGGDYHPGAKDRHASTNDHYASAEYHQTAAQNHDTRTEGCGVFQPVTVAPATGAVVVWLPGGTRIEVNANHLEAIRAILAETIRIDQSRAAEQNASSAHNRVIRKRGGSGSC